MYIKYIAKGAEIEVICNKITSDVFGRFRNMIFDLLEWQKFLLNHASDLDK